MRTRIAGIVIVAIVLTGTGCHRTRRRVRSEIETLRAAYAAFNRGDIEAAVKDVDPDVEWTEPREFPGGGAYHGREAVKQYLAQSRANWAEGSSQPERFIPFGRTIVALVRAHVRLKGSAEWHDRRLADVFTFRHGVIIRMRAFADRDRALQWAESVRDRAPD